MSSFICSVCGRTVKYSNVTEEYARNNHKKNCIDISSQSDSHNALYSNLLARGLCGSNSSSNAYLKTVEYRDSQEWKPEDEWCRYCGARKTSGWYKGPWGAHSLCTVHYVQWKQRKILNLDQYTETPLKPINISANSEGEYLDRMAQKHV